MGHPWDKQATHKPEGGEQDRAQRDGGLQGDHDQQDHQDQCERDSDRVRGGG